MTVVLPCVLVLHAFRCGCRVLSCFYVRSCLDGLGFVVVFVSSMVVHLSRASQTRAERCAEAGTCLTDEGLQTFLAVWFSVLFCIAMVSMWVIHEHEKNL